MNGFSLGITGLYDQLEKSLGEFVEYFNAKRIHQSLDYRTPNEAYEMGTFSMLEKDTKVA